MTKIEAIPLFKNFTASEITDIKICLKEKNFEKGDLLFQEGNSCERVFIVDQGQVKLYRTSSEGRDQVLEVLGPGDTCACNPGVKEWSCSSTAEAVTKCKVWFLSRENYLKMVQSNSQIVHTLNRLFAERLSRFSCMIEDVSLKDVKKRLIKFLLDMLSENKTGSNTILIPFTREEIAHRIGSARETVARYLYQLKRKKLIDIKPRQIVILDKEALKKLL